MPAIAVTIGGASAAVLSYAVDELLVAAPALSDGVYDLELTDPATGATAAIPGAITYGGGGATTLQMLLGSNPPVPVGVKAPNPFRVRVLAAGSGVPVAGASVAFTAPGSSVSLLPCNTTACVVATDGTGEADIWILVKAAGATTITASLANGQTASATVNGVSGSLMISAAPPKVYVAANTTASIPLLARVAGNGAVLPGRLVEFQILLGSGSLTATTVTTDSAGEAHSTLVVTNLASEVRVSACVGVAPQTACDIFYVYPVGAGSVQLLKAGGDQQYLPAGQAFAPVRVRVSDSNLPPNSVSGMAVRFQSVVYRDQGGSSTQQAGEVVTGHRSQPVALSSSDVTVYSDGWGQASYTPQIAASWGVVRIDIQASIAGGQTVSFTLHTLSGTGSNASSERGSSRSLRLPPASEVRVSTCAGGAPQTACNAFYFYPAIAGGVQDGSSTQPAGEAVAGQRSQPVAVSSSDVTVYSDASGQASYTPQTAAAWGAARIDIQASIAAGQKVSFTLHTLGEATPNSSITPGGPGRSQSPDP